MCLACVGSLFVTHHGLIQGRQYTVAAPVPTARWDKAWGKEGTCLGRENTVGSAPGSGRCQAGDGDASETPGPCCLCKLSRLPSSEASSPVTAKGIPGQRRCICKAACRGCWLGRRDPPQPWQEGGEEAQKRHLRCTSQGDLTRKQACLGSTKEAALLPNLTRGGMAEPGHLSHLLCPHWDCTAPLVVTIKKSLPRATWETEEGEVY